MGTPLSSCFRCTSIRVVISELAVTLAEPVFGGFGLRFFLSG